MERNVTRTRTYSALTKVVEKLKDENLKLYKSSKTDPNNQKGKANQTQ